VASGCSGQFLGYVHDWLQRSDRAFHWLVHVQDRKGHNYRSVDHRRAGRAAATVIGNWIPGSPLEPFFSLSKGTTVLALCGLWIHRVGAAGLDAALPRDYLSSFLKIGTIALMIVGVSWPIHPTLSTVNHGLPEWRADLFGGRFSFRIHLHHVRAISGFHALVSSGTTPKDD